MSSRTIRKLFGTTALPPLEGNSDEEFEPHYTKDTISKFSGLSLNSHSESEHEGSVTAEAAGQQEEKKKKKKKNKKKQRRGKPNVTNNNSDHEMDEIDKSVMEVNAILGGPPQATCAPVEKKKDPKKQLLSVQAKHLDFNNELKRIFGSESLDDSRGKKCRPHNVVKYRRASIVPIPENRHYVSVGLSMSLQRKENDSRSYFTFDHNREYQKMHQHFLEVMSHEDVVPMDDNHRNVHIEGLLQSADYMFRAEEYTAANNLLEQVISYLHYVAHPCFNLTDQSIRLEYKYMENRPFHIAVLKYCHMLTNKACHRTALELAKLLLNLDPSDPLAVILIIDTIALRARQHQWLIDTVDYWQKERDAGYLFNIKYSYAMAHFHVARKTKSIDFTRADELVKEAMLHYPSVATRLFENCKQDCSKITNHPYFSLAGEDKFPEKIKTAMILHTKMVCWRWREPEVMQWFLRNATELVDKLDNDPVVKKRGEELVRHRHSLYAACPDQIHRHLHVIRPMSNLLVEWELPQLTRQPSWDPLPPTDGVNRYGYTIASNVDPRHYSGLFNLFARFFGPEDDAQRGVPEAGPGEVQADEPARDTPADPEPNAETPENNTETTDPSGSDPGNSVAGSADNDTDAQNPHDLARKILNRRPRFYVDVNLPASPIPEADAVAGNNGAAADDALNPRDLAAKITNRRPRFYMDVNVPDLPVPVADPPVNNQRSSCCSHSPTFTDSEIEDYINQDVPREEKDTEPEIEKENKPEEAGNADSNAGMHPQAMLRLASMHRDFSRLLLEAARLPPEDMLDPEEWDFYLPEDTH